MESSLEKRMKPVSLNEDGLLTKLFRKVLFETATINKIGYLLDRYMKTDGKKNRATVTKIMTEGEMTWKSFIFLLFKVVKVKSFILTVEIEDYRGEKSQHSLLVEQIPDKLEKKDQVSKKKGKK